MAIFFQRRPVEGAARVAAALLRQSIEPIELACATLGRIALLHFQSPEVEAAFAEKLRQLSQNLRARNQADGPAARSILAGIRELEKKAILLASSKT